MTIIKGKMFCSYEVACYFKSVMYVREVYNDDYDDNNNTTNKEYYFYIINYTNINFGRLCKLSHF